MNNYAVLLAKKKKIEKIREIELRAGKLYPTSHAVFSRREG